jgi:putative transposase
MAKIYKAYKVRLTPKDEGQLESQNLHVRAYRTAWNWGLALQKNRFEEKKKRLSKFALITEFRKIRDALYPWMAGTSSHSVTHALCDLDEAYQRFFRVQKEGVKYTPSVIQAAAREGRKLTPYDMKGHPKFKKLGRAKESFYIRDTLYFKDGYAVLEKIGKVKYQTDYVLPEGKGKAKFYNPRVALINGKWMLSFSMEVEVSDIQLNEFAAGIDLGVKELAVVSYDNSKRMIFNNVNKEPRVVRLKKQLKHAQRNLSRSQRPKKGEAPSNRRVKKRIRLADLHRRLADIRRGYTHNVTRKIVNLLPAVIVLEDLNVRGLMKNHHLARAIAEQTFYEFRRQIEYKAAWQGTKIRLADRFEPSSKRCSDCGAIKKDLKLKDRVYHCECCGFVEDRDFNAARNLEKLAKAL